MTSISIPFRMILGCSALLAAFPQAAAAARTDSHRPNIIFIFADDIGIAGVSSYGADNFATPHLDGLARKGIRFEHAFSAPICGPSRAQTLTGRYPFRTGAIGNGSASKLNPEKEVPLPRVLRAAGYVTGAVGKWSQLQFMKTAADGLKWGFDEYLLWTGAGTKDPRYWGPRFNLNGAITEWPKEKYGPDVMQQWAIDFITRHKDRPFYLHYPNLLPHGPAEPTPLSRPNSDRKQQVRDMVTYLDQQVAELVSLLERLGIAERTLLVFTGDNGNVGGGTVNGRQIAGGKGGHTEGATRVPLIAYWKGTTPEGRVVPDLMDFSDFFPTFCELAGASLPPGITYDGYSFAPQLRGQKGIPREWVFAQIAHPGDNHRWIRDHHWKLDSKGVLTSTKDAPFSEILADPSDPSAMQARAKLQRLLNQLQ